MRYPRVRRYSFNLSARGFCSGEYATRIGPERNFTSGCGVGLGGGGGSLRSGWGLEEEGVGMSVPPEKTSGYSKQKNIKAPPNKKLAARGIAGRVGIFISLISNPPPIKPRTISARPRTKVMLYRLSAIACPQAKRASHMWEMRSPRLRRSTNTKPRLDADSRCYNKRFLSMVEAGRQTEENVLKARSRAD